MRTTLMALLLGATLTAVAPPAFANDPSADQLGQRLRDRIADRNERYEDRRERREERREERAERREERREDRRDRLDDRRDDRRDRWEDRRYEDRGYAYRNYGGGWNRQWTPYGFGYNDGFTRNWVLRNFADRNNNGRVGEKEWRRAQVAFYRLADRNYDGYISRFEYDWAIRELRRSYAARW
jgi:hypothetical protein